ncbi:MAG: GNAT family N-acetyltransferase [Bacilli bacterium]|jgi:GNAT superfamily N-acetyltransferase|nr:GNAT family N-acetyltransferase [Bacilli bacterium]
MIRPGKVSDLPAIMAIVSDAVQLLKDNQINQWQNGYPNEAIFAQDIEKKTCYVYEKDNKVVGVANIDPNRDLSYDVIEQGSWLTDETKGDRYLVVHRLAVKKEYYHQGITYELLEFAFAKAKKLHLQSIRVDTHRDNKTMNILLQKMGFVRCGIIYLVNYLDEDKVRTAYEKVI